MMCVCRKIFTIVCVQFNLWFKCMYDHLSHTAVCVYVSLSLYMSDLTYLYVCHLFTHSEYVLAWYAGLCR